MLKNYLLVFFVSMVPVVELRGAIPIGLGLGLPVLPTYLLIKVHHQLVAVEDCILEIVDKLDCTEVTCVHTEFAEHAVAQVVLVIYQLALLLACLWVLHHLGYNLDGIVRA